MHAQSLQLCQTLGNLMACCPPGSSVPGFSWQEYWRGLPFPPPGDLPSPGIEPTSPASPALQADSLLLSHWGSPSKGWVCADVTAYTSLGAPVTEEYVLTHQIFHTGLYQGLIRHNNEARDLRESPLVMHMYKLPSFWTIVLYKANARSFQEVRKHSCPTYTQKPGTLGKLWQYPRTHNKYKVAEAHHWINFKSSNNKTQIQLNNWLEWLKVDTNCLPDRGERCHFWA